MSTAQKTKSTCEAISSIAEAFFTVRAAVADGIAVASAQRPFTASAYRWPAELALAATIVTSYQG